MLPLFIMTRESYTQQAAVKWFRMQYPQYARLLIHIPNEGKRSTKLVRTRDGYKTVCISGSRLKAEGMVKGVSDLVLFVPNGRYHGLCIETKTESIDGNGKKVRTYQSKEQRQWQEEVERQGYMYAVYRNVEEFVKIVNGYLTM